MCHKFVSAIHIQRLISTIKSCFRVAGLSGVQEKMMESLLKKILVRVYLVVRRVPPSEIRRSTRRGGSQLKNLSESL